MATYKQGLTSRSLKKSPDSLFQQYGKDSIMARVTDIVLSPDHPSYDEVGRRIGAIFFSSLYPDTSPTKLGTSIALPLNFHNKTYPLIDEIVLLVKGSNNTLSKSPSNSSFYYKSIINVWNTPNHNAYPNTNRSQPPSPSPFIKAELSSPTDSTQTFEEKGNIKNILPQMGDTIMEGRNGQSIRFSQEKGNPITYIRNGQDRTTPSSGFEPITENVKNDLSSIYLTSYQKLPNLSLETEKGTPFISYTTPPITPSQFDQPQVVLNSDRVVIEAETDSVLISAGKSVGLFSNESINVESNDINFHTTNRIRLGSKNAGESVLLGDKTYDVIEFTLNVLKILSDTLTPNQIYPSGTPVPDASTQVLTSTISEAIETVKEKVLVNIKSNKVKVE